MLAYRYPAYRLPAALMRPSTVMKGNLPLGSIGDMTLGDWLLLVGGGIVGGAGVNALLRQFIAKPGRVDAISIALGLVLTAVGGTVFVQKFGKLIS